MRSDIKAALKICSLLLLSFLFFSSPSLFPQEKPILKFSNDGKFKIVQFTDVHLVYENKPQSDSVISSMISVLASEKPDFVILTGDIVTSENNKAGWEMATKPMVDAGIPWAAVFGNHDHEQGYTNKQLMDYIITLPLNLSAHGPSDIYGIGNYTLEILGSKSNKTEALMYCFDSNAYTGGKDEDEIGVYDWIKFNQIQWYRTQSKKYTEQNNNKPYPALSFFHIPLPEYAEVQKKASTIGDKDETICSPKVNSGLYNAFLESKDVMAVFCGHDHENNYIGTLNNIALAYGCKTGKDSYGKLDKGGRVIVLYEGERKFDAWIHTTKDAVKYSVTYPDTFNKK
jgi:predicted MPP superfamily phosphohydrolase